ncbi:ABC transporter ATP-binding protein [Desulfocucumis palustris]|uniref:ABC transporter ATP-binding protein n=1 Tax=Desulfocucumis palustris TaxID=1898651 RepID=A0A2L2XCH3_9FIRM|nr:ABC transporter ATP-binding protein [Desulfocucumis palustris]GBF33812.1 ABC transporter ATP-binding protein [Desulfocucumis palustris]
MKALNFITLKNVNKIFGRGLSPVRALEIDLLEIDKGEFVSFTGPSGCGKTTLLNLIGALDRPSSGEIFIGGRNIACMGEAELCRYRRNTAGFVFQSYCLIPSLSAYQNVLVPCYPLGKLWRFRDRARELLRAVGLGGKENRLPAELSGGEQQRVAVARALLLEPDIILADEPTGNLDSATGAGITGLLKKLSEEGKTVVIATHDSRVAGFCGRNIRLEDGRPLLN